MSTFVLLLTACQGVQITEKLNQIDSLVVKERYDTAYSLLKELGKVSMTADDQAHYNLLETQLGYLTNHPLPSDSILDLALTYYNKVDNKQKLADVYYYKSCRSRIEQNYPQAVLYCKKAEFLAKSTNNIRLQYKVYENLSFLNALCGNDLLQLQYAKKSLDLAQAVHNNNWIAYSYNKICFAFANLNQFDSAFFYVEKSIPFFKYVYDSEKAGYLANIALLYVDNNPNIAKQYYEKALKYGEHPGIYENLAEIYYSEGEKEMAYKLWKKALITSGRYEKTNIIHNILVLDLEQGKLDEVSKNVNEIVAIKDSIISSLKNDTIKDLQLRFDHEVAMHEVDKKLINTQRIVIGLILLLVLMAFYIYRKRKREQAQQKEHQMELYAFTTEISQLKANRENALTQIRELKQNKGQDRQRIEKLLEDAKNADIAIEKLNKEVKKLLDDKSPKLKQGRMYYDHIINGGTSGKWGYKEETLFNYYYASTHYQSYNRLRNVERAAKLSAHNMFYLILKEMGKDDGEIRRIMVISQEGLRSLRSRTKPKEKE